MGGGASIPFYVAKILEPKLDPVDDIFQISDWNQVASYVNSDEWSNKLKPTDENDIGSWNYNIYQLDINGLILLSYEIVRSSGLNECFAIDPRVVGHFLRTTEGIMSRHNNHYHNFRHVIDVMHGTYLMLETFNAKQYLTDLERLALTFGAIVHDLDHPGTNNTYHSNKGTVLSIIYNDNAILENYHCARTFELFSIPECNIVSSLNATQFKEFRRLVIMEILSTDMAVHFAMKADLDKLHTRFDADYLDRKDSVLLDQKEHDLMIKVILHGSDISNPSKSWDVCKKWSDMVIEEFFAQGDLEKSENLPVSMNCDRDTTFQDELSMNFSDFIVGPFYQSITKLLPNAFVTCDNLNKNRSQWFDMYRTRVDADNADEALQEKLDKWHARAVGATKGFEDIITEAKAR